MPLSGTLLGRTLPRTFTAPLVKGRRGPCGCGCALTPKTSLGFSAAQFAEDVLGIRLFPWQRWLLIHAMELRRDGRFRYRTVLVLVARQNGKTSLVEVKNLWKMFVLRVPLVINTAQNLDVSEESWDKACEIVESIPDLNAEVEQVTKINGKKTLKLQGGSRWKVATASRKGGRGLSGDDVNLDELREHQSWDAWGAVTKTTLAIGKAPGRQVWAYSNAGDSKSVVLNDLQDKGRAAVEHPESSDSSLGYFEWSAPDRCDIEDEALWPLANPSMGYPGGIDVEALRAALRTDPEPVFRTECLCQRVDNLTPEWLVIPKAHWLSRIIDPVKPDRVAFGVAASWPDAENYAVGVAGEHDGRIVVQLVDHRPGRAWVPGMLRQLREKNGPVPVVMRDRGPTAALHADLTREGFELTTPWVKESAAAFAAFRQAAVEGQPAPLAHFNQDPLNAAVAAAERQPAADGWVWARKGEADISPVEAVTLAAWGHTTHGRLAATGEPLIAWI